MEDANRYAAPPAAKRPKNAWTLTASLIQNLESNMGGRPNASAAIARLTSSSLVQPSAMMTAGMMSSAMGTGGGAAAASTSGAAAAGAAGGSSSSAAAGGGGGGVGGGAGGGAGGGGGLKLTFRMGGAAAAPAMVDGEEAGSARASVHSLSTLPGRRLDTEETYPGEQDIFVDSVDGLPGDTGLKIFGKRKPLCVRPAAAAAAAATTAGGEDAAAAAAAAVAANAAWLKEREENAAAEEVYAEDGEMPPGAGEASVSKPKRQRTPPPPSHRPPIPPRVDEATAGGEEYFMANWRYFLEWNLKKDPDEIVKKLDNNQNRSGKPFDIYGFYAAVVSRGGYQDEDFAKANISMVEVYREMHNHRNGHTYTSIGNILHKLYQTYFLGRLLTGVNVCGARVNGVKKGREDLCWEDINDDNCFVCGKLSGSMISCDKCDRWTHVKCHRRGAKRAAGVQFISARATTEIEFVCDECWRKERGE